jgi:hypothetical protein
MEIPFRRHTPYDQQFATSLSRQHRASVTEKVQRMEQDVDRDARLEAGECLTCYYLRRPRVGGSAMTTWWCGLCGTPCRHGSTAVPKVCPPCSDANHLCRECGGDLDLRDRRRKWATPVTATAPTQTVGAAMQGTMPATNEDDT